MNSQRSSILVEESDRILSLLLFIAVMDDIDKIVSKSTKGGVGMNQSRED